MTSSKALPKQPIRNVPAPQGRPSVYSRFIPREELNDNFAAWTPGAFDSSGQAAGAQPLGVQRPVAPAPQPVAAAAPSAEEELQALLQATRQQAYQDGYRDGLAALDAFKQTHARQVAGQVGALLQSTCDQLDELQQQMAQALATAAANLARQIVRSELRSQPELIARVATEALDTLLLSARHITLRVNPADQAIVAEGAADVLAARGGRIVTDNSVERGGCLVESDIGNVDASMQARWKSAVAELDCATGWNDEEAGAEEDADAGDDA